MGMVHSASRKLRVRRRLVVRAVVLCVWAGVCPSAAADSAQPSRYAEVAGQVVGALEPRWDARAQRYDPGRGGTATIVNANLLLVYSVAARRGLSGPVRDDARARSIARFLTRPPIWRSVLPPGDWMLRGPGWMDGLVDARRHLVHDSEAAEALAQAYAAREALGLDARSRARIRREIALVARGPVYAWPALRLNQFNWSIDLLAADARVNGRTDALAAGLRRHLRRFLASERNLGPGLRFRYLPAQGDRARLNLDSPEYANIVLGFSRHYAAARAAGMARPARLGLLRDWVRRVLAGYWTHAGYLNWDTGLGFQRWHQRKKVALAQRALIGIAASPELQGRPDEGAWAKWLLDRGLDEYMEVMARHGHIPADVAYGVPERLTSRRSHAYVAAARVAGNAMRALEAGLEAAPAAKPPALYSYDRDTGKLAISTPVYNTAIVPANQRAFPYGGLDIARLFDAEQEVAGNLGGTGAAAFGLTVRARGRTVLRTQYGERSYGTNPLRVRGSATSRVHAGTFSELRVRGTVRAGRWTAASAYRFTPDTIGGTWSAGGPRGRATVTFPSWGGGASVTAERCDGRSVRVGAAALGDICRLHIQSARTGYSVTPTKAAVARLVRVRRERSNPNPGPSVAVDLGPLPATFAATIRVMTGTGSAAARSVLRRWTAWPPVAARCAVLTCR